jgi:hypothetical protein
MRIAEAEFVSLRCSTAALFLPNCLFVRTMGSVGARGLVDGIGALPWRRTAGVCTLRVSWSAVVTPGAGFGSRCGRVAAILWHMLGFAAGDHC